MIKLYNQARDRYHQLSPRRQSTLLDGAVFFLFALLAVLLTWPVIAQSGRAFPGFQIGDQFQLTWLYSQAKDAILAGRHPAHFTQLGCPTGYFSPLRALASLHMLLAFPFELLFTPVRAYSLLWLTVYTLNGFAAYLLCLDVVKDRRAAFVGGLVLMQFPLRVLHGLAGHLEVGDLTFTMLFILFLRRTILDPTYRHALVTGLFMALAAMSHISASVYAAAPLTVVLVVGCVLLDADRRRSWPVWRALLIVVAVGLLILLPIAAPLLRQTAAIPYNWQTGGDTANSTSLFTIFRPPPTGLVWSHLLPESLRQPPDAMHEVAAYWGFFAMLLIVLALVRRRSESGLWIAAAITGHVLALGPLLKVGGEVVSFTIAGQNAAIPLPYTLVDRLPLLSLGRTPGRFNLSTGIAVAVLAAQGALIMIEWLSCRPLWLRRAALPLLCVLIVLDTQVGWPLPVRSAAPPSAVAALAAEPGPGGVLNIPTESYDMTQEAMGFILTHRRSMVGGHDLRDIEPEPGLVGLLGWQANGAAHADIIPAPSPDAVRTFLADQGIGYVIVGRGRLQDAATVEAWQQIVFGDPLAVDAAAAVYRVDASGTPDLPLMYGLDTREGWSPTTTFGGLPARWLTGPADLVIYAPQPVSGSLRFRALAPDAPRHLSLIVNDEPAAVDLVIGEYLDYLLPGVTLAEGLNVIRFIEREPCRAVSGDPRCMIGCSLTHAPLSDAECWLDDPRESCTGVLLQSVEFLPSGDAAASTPFDVHLGESISLIDYRRENDPAPGETFAFTLAWQALAPTEGRVHYFVHLVDEQGGIVAQSDGAPLRDAYPTTSWSPGEIIHQRIELALPPDLPPGSYTLFTGMYRYPELDRLLVSGSSPEAQNGLIQLEVLSIGSK